MIKIHFTSAQNTRKKSDYCLLGFNIIWQHIKLETGVKHWIRDVVHKKMKPTAYFMMKIMYPTKSVLNKW